MTVVVENTIDVTEPLVSATRRAFEANEIKEGIFRNCDRKSLRNLAVVDRQWSEAALDVLWYEVTALEDLLRPLGPVTSTNREIQTVIVHTVTPPSRPNRFSTGSTTTTTSSSVTEITYELSPSPTHRHWLRFQRHYAPRVRILRFKVIDTRKTRSLVNLLLQMRSFEALLPNLRVIHWDTLCNIGLAEPMFAFAHDVVQELNLTDIQEHCPDKSITCEAILTRMPKLTKLVLEILPDEKYIPSLISIMEGLTSLQSLTISPFSNMSEIVSCLSGLQKLKELHILSGNRFINVHSPFSLRNSNSSYFSVLERITLSCAYQIASGFFCCEVPSLIAIRVVTSIREQPSDVQNILRTISGSCPRVTQISLEIRHNTIDLSALRAPLSPESALTLEVLSSILQRSSICSFSIQHPLPFDVGLGEVETIASSWPRLKSLSLACDPYLVQQPTTSYKLGVDAFLPFVRHCPDIEELGLFIDARSSAIPSNEVLDALPSPFTKLRILSVGTSVIRHEEAIAQFLSFICTQGCIIKQGVSWFEQYGQHLGESARKWMEVNRLLRNLLAVRIWYERKLVLEMRRLQANLCDQTK
ncbi:hypothetical protein K435DRAFT_871363 [Dendrothele bispora CBS 962.96]|uniref:F-box domain-containing protein n=1 Tax=Dendrothele bispora (strain CBS 962.96) TaxID=1314807 RepID=A0A4S8L4N9_DENBC|nr:hypothetical protein K435DRAFT_871363 [Dendrothele bispora CBS 962.96]